MKKQKRLLRSVAMATSAYLDALSNGGQDDRRAAENRMREASAALALYEIRRAESRSKQPICEKPGCENYGKPCEIQGREDREERSWS